MNEPNVLPESLPETDQTPPAPSASPADLLTGLLSNPKLVNSIKEALGNPSADAPSGPPALLSDPAIYEKMPLLLNLLRAQTPAAQEGAGKPVSAGGADAREGLLLALKPFLSPGRRNAVDTVIGLSKLGGVLKQMQ